MNEASLQRNPAAELMSAASLAALSKEFRRELMAIGDWWLAHSFDTEAGGFYGEIRPDNTPVKSASKGIVLNSRILWFFSEIALETGKAEYRNAATRAYDYLINFFLDKEFGGVFWELDTQGNPLNTKKQTYAQAFAIYALCSYYKLTGNQDAMSCAMDCFALLEANTIDREKEGYFEAFTREWGKMDDVRLSDKDLNYPKSMNTHLHVLEAYTTLHKVNPSAAIKQALRYNIECFDKYLIDKSNWHLRMFLDDDWQDFSPGFTYGHDIETSWLLSKALDSLGDDAYSQALHPTIVNIAKVTLQQAMGDHGEVLDAFDFATQQRVSERVWWVQAEALVGFLNACLLSGEEKYFSAACDTWQFIKSQQIDAEHGEWLWLSKIDEPHGDEPYKVGFWKGPYHNGRAMMEAIRFIEKLKK